MDFGYFTLSDNRYPDNPQNVRHAALMHGPRTSSSADSANFSARRPQEISWPWLAPGVADGSLC